MASWIRVDTHISRDPRLTRARRILGVDKATMVGHYVMLETELALQRPSGELAGIGVEVLAEWAGWDGELPPFETAIAELTEDGKLAGWDETQGKRIEYLESERERKRADRERRKKARDERRHSEGQDADSPQDVHGAAADVRRYGTIRDGTIRNGTVPESSLASEAASVVPQQLERASDARAREEREEPARSLSALPNDGTANSAANGSSSANGTPRSRDTFALPPSARALLERCYGQSKVPGRFAEVRQQLLDTMTPTGVLLEGDERVRAVDETHLDAACTAVLGGTLKKPNAAIHLVLLKLRDTYTDRLAATEAVRGSARRNGRGGSPARPADVLAPPVETTDQPKVAERRRRSLEWAKTHPDRATLIERRIRGSHPRLSDRALAEFLIAEFAAAMEADPGNGGNGSTEPETAAAGAAAGGA